MSLIIPVILCGGSGSRLWPASRDSYPKQFLSLTGDRSLFQNTLARHGTAFRRADRRDRLGLSLPRRRTGHATRNRR